MLRIKEAVVVEGRDDTAAVKKAVDCITIETHGFGINDRIWALIETAHREKGIIVFTDPDHAGEQIRRRIRERFPDAKEAFLDRSLAERKGDIGIENAAPGDIAEALLKARCVPDEERADTFDAGDMNGYRLAGYEGSSDRRRKLGQALGIGYANSRAFLRRLNRFGVSRDDLERALREIS